jgi:hypothetical protein
MKTMTKRKSSKYGKKEKALRRQVEVLKAQLNTSNVKLPLDVEDNNSTGKKTESIDKYALPIENIRKDLLKTALYVVFSVVAIVVLKVTGFRPF